MLPRLNPGVGVLQSLYLSFCGIDEAGGKPLAQLLAFPSSGLKLLDLEGNHLRSRGLMAVADALKTNTALQQLRFCNNGVGAVRPPRVARCTNTLLTRTAWTPSSLSCATGRRSGSEQGHDGGAG